MVKGSNVPPAEVLFNRGLNIITGPSNTGKSYIFQCIYYMLGASKPPKDIPIARPYSNIYLEIEDSEEQVYTLESDRKGGEFKLYHTEIENVNHDTEYRLLNRKHNSENSDNISMFLLELNNLLNIQVRQNAKGKKRHISYRDIVKFHLIDENTIITDKSPIFSGQYTEKTVEESVFKFLVTGNDDSAIVESVSEKVTTNRRGKIEMLVYLINSAKNELNKDHPNYRYYNTNLEKIDSRIDSVISSQLILKNTFRRLDEERKELANRLSELKNTDIYYSELLLRSEILLKQYVIDLDRLKSTREASDFFVAGHSVSGRCPLCQSQLNEGCSNEDIIRIIESCNVEIKKIKKLIYELKQSEKLLIIEKEDNLAKIYQTSESLNSISSEIDSDLSLKIEKNLVDLNNLYDFKVRFNHSQFIRDKIKSLEVQKLEIEKSLEKTDGSFEKISTAMLSELSEVLKLVLEGCKYPDLTSVSFSESKTDFVISGEDRELPGKGYRAIIYSAFIVALQKYLLLKPFSIGPVVLDSPLVTYKKPNMSDLSELDLISKDLAMDFYRYIAHNHDSSQIIIIENEEPPEDIKHLHHHIKFTQSPTNGRYGFFPLTQLN